MFSIQTHRTPIGVCGYFWGFNSLFRTQKHDFTVFRFAKVNFYFFSGNNLPGHHRFHPPCSFRFVDGVEVRKICGYPYHQPDCIGVYFEHFVDAIDWEKVYVDGIYVKPFVDGIDVRGFVDGVEVKKICGRNKSIGLTVIKWTEPK